MESQPSEHRISIWPQIIWDHAVSAYESIFTYEMHGWHRWLAIAWLGLLFLAGGFLWWYFWNGGTFQLDLHDWGEVTSHRYAFVQNAAKDLKLPLHMPGFWGLRNLTDRFISIPDTPLSPQFFLLRWLTIDRFVLVNTLLLYATGYVGLLLVRRKLHLSIVAFSILFFLMVFNGHIAAHLAVGHANWTSHFLLPFFALFVIQMLEQKRPWRDVLLLSLLLFVLFLQGAFHLYVVCLLFLSILGLTRSDLFRVCLQVIIFTILLSMVRVLPPLLIVSKFDTEFLSGFTTVGEMLAGLTILKMPVRENLFLNNSLNPLGWWELDYYIGLTGLIILLVCGIYLWARNHANFSSLTPLVVPIFTLVVFSIGRIYKIFHVLQIPLLSSQRVASRIFIVPLIFLFTLSAIFLQRELNQQTGKRPLQWLILGTLVLLAHDLWQHLKLWRITNMGAAFPPKDLDITLDIIANHPDPPYIAALILGAIFSLGTLIYLIVKAWSEHRASTIA